LKNISGNPGNCITGRKFIYLFIYLFIYEVGKIREKATFNQKEGTKANHRTCHLTKPRLSQTLTSKEI
jgi:hypothetical protein